MAPAAFDRVDRVLERRAQIAQAGESLGALGRGERGQWTPRCQWLLYWHWEGSWAGSGIFANCSDVTEPG